MTAETHDDCDDRHDRRQRHRPGRGRARRRRAAARRRRSRGRPSRPRAGGRGRGDGGHPRRGRGAGVARRDIRTTLLSVQPRYDYRDGKAPALTGYDLANVVEVTVRDLAALGDVIDGALTAGATSLDGLTFRVDDPRAAERDARTAAVAEARARADVLAEAAGLTIAGVGDIVEGGRAADLAAAEGGPDDGWPPMPATPVEAGTTEIAVTVTVTFRTRPDRPVSRRARDPEQLHADAEARRVDGAVVDLADRAERPTQSVRPATGLASAVAGRIDQPRGCPSRRRRRGSRRRARPWRASRTTTPPITAQPRSWPYSATGRVRPVWSQPSLGW